MLDAFIIERLKKLEEEEEIKQEPLRRLTIPFETEPEPATEKQEKQVTIKF